ncbi:hypothetical protein SCHPADRAFT_902971 [Schizopora paradoxa]|uniref:Uncharacterized protein n=1 Tax=Schizopora paradoxa TaxID=27342 RepID=A0A0H2RS49_9AGAM|nr:hypothetical protein SCHPADRAFT_902971 [Schizopora paradoxa]
MAKLPPHLAPLGKYAKSKPPKFHFGWVLDNPDILLDIGKSLGVQPRKHEEDHEDHEDHDSDDDSEDDEESDCTVSMTDVWMRMDALQAVSKELELKNEPYLARVICPGKPNPRVLMISLVENYSLKDGFTRGIDIQNLMKYFDFKTGPMWYLDGYFWMWDSTRFWCSC